jgi:ankyrin repeat protein
MASKHKGIFAAVFITLGLGTLLLNVSGGSSKSMSFEKAEWASLMAEYGLDKDGSNLSKSTASDILVQACSSLSVATYERLLKITGSTNVTDNNGNTVLHSCQKGIIWDRAASDYFNENKTLDIPNHSGVTPLMEAALKGNISTLEWLKTRGADPKAVDQNGSNILFYADAKTYPIVQMWFPMDEEPTNANGQTLLMLAIQQNQTDKAKKLLEHAPTLELQDRFGQTALHYAAQRGNDIITREIISRNLELAYIENKNRETPLEVATGSSVNILREYTNEESTSRYRYRE